MPEKARAMAAAAGAEAVPIPEAPTTTPAAEPTMGEEEIASRAYSYWEARGYEGGSPDEDWFRAIEELTREHNT